MYLLLCFGVAAPEILAGNAANAALAAAAVAKRVSTIVSVIFHAVS